MAAVKPKPKKGSLVSSLQRKAGPLPVWAWSLLLLVVGYVAYRHYQGTSTTSSPAGTVDTTPIPPSDMSGAGGALGGGLGAGATYNYYSTNDKKLQKQIAALNKKIAKLTKQEKKDRQKAHLTRGKVAHQSASSGSKPVTHRKHQPTPKHTKATVTTRRPGGGGRPKLAQ